MDLDGGWSCRERVQRETWRTQGRQRPVPSPWTLCPSFFLPQVTPWAQYLGLRKATRGPRQLPQNTCEVRRLWTWQVLEPQGVVS